ncbi:ATP-binding protein, partial [Eisenbergiella tayi]
LLYADDALLRRMLSNLIRNSILHNAEGCRITVLIGSTDNCCTFTVSDTGTGLSESQLQSLNSGHAIPSTCKETNNADHGLGLKIVRQIVKVHQGEIHFSNNAPHGLCVEIRITRYA